MLEYEFETLRCDGGGGYSLLGGIGLETEGHQAAILHRAGQGWRYVGWIPRKQRAEGYVEAIDLVFERQEPNDGQEAP